MVKGVYFTKRVKEDNWVDSSLHLPVFGRMFNINVVWFDLEEEMTYAAIRKMVKGDDLAKGSEIYCVEKRKRIVHPKQICQQSSLKKG